MNGSQIRSKCPLLLSRAAIILALSLIILAHFTPAHADPGQLTVKGYVRYYDRSTLNSYAAYYLVGLFNYSSDQWLTWGYTDSGGYFELGPVSNPGADEVALKIYTYMAYEAGGGSNEIMAVHQGGSGWADAYIHSFRLGALPDGLYDAGTKSVPNDQDKIDAFWIKNDLEDGYRYTLPHDTFDMGSYTAQWVHDWQQGTEYVPGTSGSPSGTIKIAARDAEDHPDMVLHEMGHNAMNNIYGYQNWPPGSISNPHYMQVSYNAGAAWKEGWATFWALAVTGDEVFEWPHHMSAADINLETPTWGTQWWNGQQWTDWDNGDTVEGRVAGALWDIFDSVDDAYDQLSAGIDEIWEAFATAADTLSDFWYTLKAEFYDKVPPARSIFQNTIIYSEVRLELTTSSTSGGDVTTPGEGTYTGYQYSVNATIVATDDTHYHFTQWTGAGVDAGKVDNPQAASTYILMDRDYAVQASFAIDQHSLTTSSTSGGDVTTPGESTYYYDYETSVNITATPDQDYGFARWTGDVSAVAEVYDASTNITMYDDYAITANFALFPTVSATLQGGSRPQSGFDVPLTVKLYSENTTLTWQNILTEPALYGYSTTNGTIDIFARDYATKTIDFRVLWDAPDGDYNMTVFTPHALINLYNGVTIDREQPPINMATLLEGNANDSNRIDITDFGILAAAYLATSQSGNWDERADFDRNGQVTILDFSLMATNFHERSPQTVGGGDGFDVLLSVGTANVTLTVPQGPIYAGDNFTVSIDIQSGSQPVTGIDAFVSFNTTYLEVVSITLGDAFTITLASDFNNDQGSMIASFSELSSPPSGNFTAGTITFHAKAATEGTDLVFESVVPRRTDMAYGEDSVLGTATDGTVVILEP